MCRKFYDEFLEELTRRHRCPVLPCRPITVCGESVYPLIVSIGRGADEKVPLCAGAGAPRSATISSAATSRVTGLLTGQDIAAQAAGKCCQTACCCPAPRCATSRISLLDDMSVEELAALGAQVTVIPQDGAAFARAALGLPVPCTALQPAKGGEKLWQNRLWPIVGRPNVGKSTLFNKLVGQRLSIVEDTPGVTRDRIYGTCEWQDQQFLAGGYRRHRARQRRGPSRPHPPAGRARHRHRAVHHPGDRYPQRRDRQRPRCRAPC